MRTKDIQSKRETEKQVVSLMIRVYCKGRHGRKSGLCEDCAALERYAHSRSDHCPFMEEKTFCSNCKVHCYKPEMREKIRAVMRYSGPRMIFYHPVMALRHVAASKKEKRKLAANGKMQAPQQPQKARFRAFWIALGFLCLALGTIGVVLPILPTVPFYLATLFCFTKSSQRLHDWFVETKLYKKHLDSYVKKEGMRMKTKLSIVATVTLLMAFGFFMMARKELWIPCGILAAVWLAHVVYFFAFVKTLPASSPEKTES